MSSPARVSFAFGVEIEMLIKPKDTEIIREVISETKWNRDDHHRPDGYHRAKLLDALPEVLRRCDITAAFEEHNAYKDWVIEGDTSLKQGEGDDYWEVELVSPVLFAHENWAEDLKELLYTAIDKNFYIGAGKFCGTHVHISPKAFDAQDWTGPELGAILKAICLFNESIVEMLPPDRKENEYAVSNPSHPKAVALNIRGLYDAAKTSGNYCPILAFIDGLQSPSDSAELYDSRWSSMNLKNLQNACDTIEFRSPPASGDVKTATHWALWTLSLVAAALRKD